MLPLGQAHSYKMLYQAGRALSLQVNTKNMRKIESHLGSLYECPVSVMCRNINWKSDDLNNFHGIFNMLAFLDKPEDNPEYQAAFGGGGIDNNI